jgi:PTS system galactitol-specific IIA component
MTNSILQLLEPTAVKLHFPAENSKEVITSLGNLLQDAGYVRDSFVEAALEREKNLPTGLPISGNFNAAIPHTDVEHVIKPGLAMATLASPVSFMNMVDPEEAVPVQLVFLLALEQPKAQIEMLKDIAGVLQNPELIEELMKAESYEDVKTALIKI